MRKEWEAFGFKAEIAEMQGPATGKQLEFRERLLDDLELRRSHMWTLKAFRRNCKINGETIKADDLWTKRGVAFQIQFLKTPGAHIAALRQEAMSDQG